MMIDISAKIKNELPVVKITDEIIVTVNNRKSTVLSVQCLARESEKHEEDDDYNEIAFISKAMEMVIGEKNAKAIEKLDLPITDYKLVYNTIMGVASGTYGEETPTE